MLPDDEPKTFMYFGYGSNLLARRIHIQNPTAVRRGIGELVKYRLDFFNNSTRWNGSPATIVPDENHSVWGSIWEINLDDMNDLDRQEGVYNRVYEPLTLPIKISESKTIICRVYKLVTTPTEMRKNVISEYNRNPSMTYINVILEGAVESELPEKYLIFLNSIIHNGQLADSKLIAALEKK